MSDAIHLRGMEFYTHHGETEAERTVGTRLSVDVDVHLDLGRAGLTDDLADGIAYEQLYDVTRAAIGEGRHHLLESVAASIADNLLHDTRIASVRVSVGKQPAIAARIESVAVTIERGRDGAPR